jgi:hypothetical protein
MSPELLQLHHSGDDDLIANFSNPSGAFDKFKQSDVYSMGLVFWEIISR